jgi:mono/diheme cytochrome c family protein
MSAFRYFSAALLLALALPVQANEEAVPVSVDLSGLPPLPNDTSGNPYRGNPLAVAVGKSAFHQACARCHGVEANPLNMPAPDLRQVNRYCRRIAQTEVRAQCMSDNDRYFNKSVQEGKIIVGVVHMPRWKETLDQQTIWAIQSYIESRTGEGR